MPHLPPPTPPPLRWPMALSAACGRGRADFYALGHNRDFDATFEATNPMTLLSPTSRFTHIVHFTNAGADRVERVPDRLLQTWWSPTRQLAYAVGFPRGVFEIDAGGVGEVILDAHRGTFFGLWGTRDEVLFACGFGPFAMRRRAGRWSELALPTLPTRQLHAVCGSAETDLLFVGGQGVILHYDGSVVTVLEVPTTRNLVSITPLGRDRYCVGGLGGTLLYGNRKGWRLVPSQVEDDLLHLANFEDRIYYATLDGLFAFDGVQPPQRVLDLPCDAVSSLGDALLVAHETHAWLYDGGPLVPLDTTV